MYGYTAITKTEPHPSALMRFWSHPGWSSKWTALRTENKN